MKMLSISQIMEKMIAFSEGNIHDIDHFVRVWNYAKTIAELEGINPDTQYILEVAAITHDIACPLCREKYGNTNGKLQEEEGVPLIKVFLSDFGMTKHILPDRHFLTTQKLHFTKDKRAFYTAKFAEIHYSKMISLKGWPYR